MNRVRTLTWTSAVFAVVLSLGIAWPDLVARAAYAVEAGQATAARENLRYARDLSSAFQDISDAIRPSVVTVRAMRVAESPQNLPFDEEMLRRFFGNRMPDLERQQPSPGFGQGTGVIVSADGYIVTNKHVVGGATSVRVRLSDDRSYDAEVIGTDDRSDLAVLKIDESGLLPAGFADSDSVRQGEWVLAFGNPFGFDQTVTSGIVSATGRVGLGSGDFNEDLIQTDAAINPGNSGGPLVNLDGEVIGINTLIFSRSGGFQGLGFAVPSNTADFVVRSIINKGRVVRGWLGVQIQPLTPALAETFGYEEAGGVAVNSLPEPSPAREAGVRDGDIIVAFNNKRVRDVNHLRSIVAATPPDTTVPVEIFRNGERRTLQVKLGVFDRDALVTNSPAQPDADLKELGLEVENLTPERSEQLGFEATQNGVLITKVDVGSRAFDAGLRQGNVIVSVNGDDVDGVSSFMRLLREHDVDRGVRLHVLDGNTKRFAVLRR